MADHNQCMKVGCDALAETDAHGNPLMFCEACHNNVMRPAPRKIRIPAKSCGNDPWSERLKCAGFCILMHLVYEGVVHWVLPVFA